MGESPLEPHHGVGGTGATFLAYLDYYRAEIVHKLTGLSDAELSGTRLPSGWTPLQLLNHLVHMETRWLRWGFTAEQVDEPWEDWTDVDGTARWVAPPRGFDELVAELHAGGERTRRIVEAADLDDLGAIGGRFEKDPPTLRWILFHVLQEYARHAGHLDIVRELADASSEG